MNYENFDILPLKDAGTVLPLVKKTMPDEVYQSAVKVLSTSIPDRRLIGAFLGLTLIGCCGVYFDKDLNRYWISWTAVDPAYQHEGIGSALLQQAISMCDRDTISVETYEHPAFFKAIGFYLKHGFRLSGFLRNYLSDGSTCLYFEKKLS